MVIVVVGSRCQVRNNVFGESHPAKIVRGAFASVEAALATSDGPNASAAATLPSDETKNPRRSIGSILPGLPNENSVWSRNKFARYHLLGNSAGPWPKSKRCQRKEATGQGSLLHN